VIIFAFNKEHNDDCANISEMDESLQMHTMLNIHKELTTKQNSKRTEMGI